MPQLPLAPAPLPSTEHDASAWLAYADFVVALWCPRCETLSFRSDEVLGCSVCGTRYAPSQVSWAEFARTGGSAGGAVLPTRAARVETS